MVAVPGLLRVDLSGCGLAALPDCLQHAASLRVLDVSDNALHDLSLVTALRELRELDACSNCVAEMPWFLGSLPKLQWLRLDGNPLPREAHWLQHAELVAYLRAGVAKLVRSLVLKLVLLGNEFAGKSTLLKALRAGHEAGRDSIDGIPIEERTKLLAIGDEWRESDMLFRLLDFPGQPEYYAANRLFLAGLDEAVVVLCASLLPAAEAERVARGEVLSDQERAEATRRQVQEELPRTLRMWLAELQAHAPERAGAAPVEVVIVATFADVAEPHVAKEWALGFDTWLRAEQAAGRFRALSVAGPLLVDSRSLRSQVRRASLDKAKIIIERRAEIPVAIDVVQKHVCFALRPRNHMPLAELRRELADLAGLRGNEALQDAALRVMSAQLDVIFDGDIVFVNPQWLSGFVSLFTTPERLGGIPAESKAMPFIVSDARAREAVTARLGAAASPKAVSAVMDAMEALDVAYPLQLRADRVDVLVPARMADGARVEWEPPMEIDAKRQLALRAELITTGVDSMPTMILGRLLYRLLQLPLFGPRERRGSRYRMSRTRLRVETPLGSRLMLSVEGRGRSGVELTYLGEDHSAMYEQQAELRQLLAMIDDALQGGGERWAPVRYRVVQRCVGCACEHALVSPDECAGKSLNTSLDDATINALCGRIFCNPEGKCTVTVLDAQSQAAAAAAQAPAAAAADDDPWAPWPRRALMLTFRQLREIRLMGEGNFGLVFSAEAEGLGRVAIKVSKKRDEVAIRNALREQYLYEALPRHRNVVPLVGVVDRVIHAGEVHERGLVMPLAACNLEQRVQNYGPLRGRVAITALADIAAGLAYLHEQRVLHRDLAPRNVLAFEDGRLALTDFGLSREVDGEAGEEDALFVARVRMDEQFPVRFAAPEVINDPYLRFYASSDIWMLGLMFWQAVTSRLPFDHIEDDHEAAKAAANADPSQRATLAWSSLRNAVPESVLAWLVRCTAHECKHRPKAVQVECAMRAEIASLIRDA